MLLCKTTPTRTPTPRTSDMPGHTRLSGPASLRFGGEPRLCCLLLLSGHLLLLSVRGQPISGDGRDNARPGRLGCAVLRSSLAVAVRRAVGAGNRYAATSSQG